MSEPGIALHRNEHSLDANTLWLAGVMIRVGWELPPWIS